MVKRAYLFFLTLLLLSVFSHGQAWAVPLRWAPPTLENPTTITLGTGTTTNFLNAGEDYIINFPASRKNGRTTLVGGRNIRIIGGHATVASPSANGSVLTIGEVTGTVHVEGLLIDNPDLNYFDAITIQDSPTGVLQVQNLRILGIHGRVSGVHGDMIQVYSGSGTGVGEIRVDRLTGTSDYQGFYIPDFPPIGSIRMQNINLSYSAPAVEGTVSYLLWLTGPDNTGCDHNPGHYENFYVQARSGQTFEGDSVFPNDGQPAGCEGVLSGSTLSWPDLADVTGYVTSGTPAVDYVADGLPGLSYVSPGYDTVDPILSDFAVASALPGTSATITWTTDENASTKADYGLTSTYTETTTESDTDPGVTSHSEGISNLLPCVTYHSRVRSKDIVLREVIGSDETFTTAGCTGAAAVADQSATSVISASGGTAELMSGGDGISFAIPASSFVATSAQFQIKQLNKTTFLSSATPPTGTTGIGDYFYNVQALSGTDTAVTSFSNPLTVTFTYNDSDISGINESTLALYRYDGSSWHQLSGCSANTVSNTISCSTTQFSDFGLFGQTQTNPSNNSSAPSQSSQPPQCSDQAPSFAPDLFQVNATNTTATLYFAPGGNPVSYYFISYGNGTETELYGVQFDKDPANGVMAYRINSLQSGKEYSFKIRGGNGCMPGAWSNAVKIKTRKSQSRLQPVEDIYYRVTAYVRYGVRVLQTKLK